MKFATRVAAVEGFSRLEPFACLLRHRFAASLVLASCFPVAPALAAGLTVQGAWVAPSAETGVDVGLYMTIRNEADEADALLRATCPVANFSERRTVDVGEGGLANRSIPNIPVAPHATLELGPKTYHVGLLQTRDKLTTGDSFTCSVTFRRAGPLEVKVMVSSSPP